MELPPRHGHHSQRRLKNDCPHDASCAPHPVFGLQFLPVVGEHSTVDGRRRKIAYNELVCVMVSQDIAYRLRASCEDGNYIGRFADLVCSTFDLGG